MKSQDLVSWATRNGFTVDRYGHLVENDVRLKLSSVSVRLEVKRDICGTNKWIRIRSGYLSKLSLTADDKLSGLTR